MANELPIEAKRFKQIREELGLTQAEMAKKLSAGATTADIERGKKKITGRVITELMHQHQVNPLWLYGLSYHKQVATTPSTSPKVVTLDAQDNENMIMVPVKASAGYAHNLQDQDWYQDLPAFQIPLPQFREGSYRSFQVQGESMLPMLQPNEWVMAQSVDSLSSATDGGIYVIVTTDSVLVKKISKQSAMRYVDLISLNPTYPPIQQEANKVVELWEVTAKLSFDLTTGDEGATMHQLKKGLDHLRDEIAALKTK